ncbi:hypothetical protein [Ralstonia soli]|uniref:Uncharacterized protein n=1 Tax=Ralstonia soli TaxID=2953896 RepID=A0ABT1AQ87_9RALS|nr:hypothetical protein [Ralstonia soli]MCO5400615.1 hypothetical protein [Ralstonia soli]
MAVHGLAAHRRFMAQATAEALPHLQCRQSLRRFVAGAAACRTPKKRPGEGNAGLSGIGMRAMKAPYKYFSIQIENKLKTPHDFEDLL